MVKTFLWWLRKISGAYSAEECQRGTCFCRNASWCYFKRCTNCDNPTNEMGYALDDGRYVEEWNCCPICDGRLNQ